MHDIKKCLDGDILMGALVMCLMLPDICGKLEYPDVKGTKARYQKWFNNFCKNIFCPFSDMEDSAKSIDFDANACYELRCAVLHSAETDISEDINIDSFDLIFKSGKMMGNLFNSSPGITEEATDKKVEKSYMNIDVAYICNTLFLIAAKYVVDKGKR